MSLLVSWAGASDTRSHACEEIRGEKGDIVSQKDAGTKTKTARCLSHRGDWRFSRRIRSGHGIVAQSSAKDRNGLRGRATSRSASRQPAFQFAGQGNADAGPRDHPNYDSKTEHGLRSAVE